MIGDRVGVLEPAQDTRIVEPGQRQVGLAQRLVDDRPGPRDRPESQAEVGVVGHLGAGRARDLEGVEHGIAGAFGDRLADPGGVQDPGTRDIGLGNGGGGHAARGRVPAIVAELMARRPMRDEIDAGRRVLVPLDPARVDPFPRPQIEKTVAEAVSADPRQIADTGADPCCRDGAVRRVAAMAQ